LEAELIFVNVINQCDIDMVEQVTIHTDKISEIDYINGLIDDRNEQMQQLLKETNCNRIPNRFLIKKGVPFLKMVETAKEEKVDMVVMGTKGRGNISVYACIFFPTNGGVILQAIFSFDSVNLARNI
jgi:nucleotide-binding universal stress UspA family protein